MEKPINPYPKNTLIWAVMEGDWEDLTPRQIAEVLDSTPTSIRSMIYRIRIETGYDVPRVRIYRGGERVG